MKFTIGDETDTALCKVLTHEMYRCEESFSTFSQFAQSQIMAGKSNENAFKIYNAYSDFIHHLYEFILGCHVRDAKNTDITNKKGEERVKIIEAYITRHAQRVMDILRDSIKRGTAPIWVNALEYYEVKVPVEFAKDFREFRNKTVGHVAYERASKLSMTEFYEKYHKFLVYLYYDAKYWWIENKNHLPELGEITDFDVLIHKQNKKT